MHSNLAGVFCSRGNLLMQGQLETLLDAYIFPFPVFLPEQRMVLSSRDEARAVLWLLLDWSKRSGVVSIRPEITAVELPRSGRFRVWVDWQELAMPLGETRLSSAIYYCRTTACGPRIEMVNYTRLSMPELNHELQALALSA